MLRWTDGRITFRLAGLLRGQKVWYILLYFAWNQNKSEKWSIIYYLLQKPKTVPVCSGDRQLVYREPWSLVTKYANTDHGSDKSPHMDGGSSVGRFIHFDWWSCFIRVGGPATLIHLFTPSRSNIRDQGDCRVKTGAAQHSSCFNTFNHFYISLTENQSESEL